jgi:fibronectin-binding autotransporter adhesin
LQAIASLTLDTDLTITGSATLSATTGQTLTLATALTVDTGANLIVGSAGNDGVIVFAPTALTVPGSGSQLTVQAGTLVADNGHLAALTASADATTVATGAKIEFQDNLSAGGIKALFGAGTVDMGSSSSTTLTVNSGSFSGVISGAGGLVKETEGTLILSGQNSYVGTTTVKEGTLIIDGDLEFGVGEVQVNAGGTLGGSGIAGTIFLNGGEVAPGSAEGSTFNANHLYWTTGTLLFDLGPTPTTSDQLALGGLQGFGTTYEFTFVDQGWVEGETYTLITFILKT